MANQILGSTDSMPKTSKIIFVGKTSPTSKINVPNNCYFFPGPACLATVLMFQPVIWELLSFMIGYSLEIWKACSK